MGQLTYNCSCRGQIKCCVPAGCTKLVAISMGKRSQQVRGHRIQGQHAALPYHLLVSGLGLLGWRGAQRQSKVTSSGAENLVTADPASCSAPYHFGCLASGHDICPDDHPPFQVQNYPSSDDPCLAFNHIQVMVSSVCQQRL